MNAENSHKWWSTLKSAVFGSDSSLPPLISTGGGLVSDPGGKAALLAAHFDNKQSRQPVNLPPTVDLYPSLTTFALGRERSRGLPTDLDPYCGTDSLGMF
jgi:hypothetical protein